MGAKDFVVMLNMTFQEPVSVVEQNARLVGRNAGSISIDREVMFAIDAHTESMFSFALRASIGRAH
jgi:hypothetical protein